MSYTTEDAIQLHHTVRAEVEEHGPDSALHKLSTLDPELLALTLLLTTLSR